jgi:hypothetical protein
MSCSLSGSEAEFEETERENSSSWYTVRTIGVNKNIFYSDRPGINKYLLRTTGALNYELCTTAIVHSPVLISLLGCQPVCAHDAVSEAETFSMDTAPFGTSRCAIWALFISRMGGYRVGTAFIKIRMAQREVQLYSVWYMSLTSEPSVCFMSPSFRLRINLNVYHDCSRDWVTYIFNVFYIIALWSCSRSVDVGYVLRLFSESYAAVLNWEFQKVEQEAMYFVNR